MISAPPIVGVPCLTRWASGPSTRICFVKPVARSSRMYGGIRITTIANASSRPWMSSTVIASRRSSAAARSSTSRSSSTPREALTSTTSPPRSVASSCGQRRRRDPATSAIAPSRQPGLTRAARRSPLRPLRRRRPVDRRPPPRPAPTRSWPASWPSPSSSISPRTAIAPAGHPGKQVERGEHGTGRRVVGVVDDRHTATTDERAAMRRRPAERQRGRDALRRETRTRDRPRPRPARCGRRAGRASGFRPGGARRRRRDRSASRRRRPTPRASARTIASGANP